MLRKKFLSYTVLLIKPFKPTLSEFKTINLTRKYTKYTLYLKFIPPVRLLNFGKPNWIYGLGSIR